VPIAAVAGVYGLKAIDRAGTTLYGLRATTGTNSAIFKLPAASGSSPTDLVIEPRMDSMVLNPLGTHLLYVALNGPFSFGLILIDTNGGGRTELASNSVVRHPRWADGGRAVVCEFYDAFFSGRRDVMFRDLTAGNLEPMWNLGILDEVVGGDQIARRLALSVLPDASVPAATPTVFDSRGGALVYLDPSKRFYGRGAPTLDDAGTRFAFCASLVDSQGNPAPPQVHVADLGRELASFPYPRLGGTVTLELPLRQGEVGGMLFAGRLSPAPIPVPGFDGPLYLDPAAMLVIAAGIGNGTSPLTFALGVPNDTGLLGSRFHLQGVRLDPLARNELTRLAVLAIPHPR
jgi:hypothetical protein